MYITKCDACGMEIKKDEPVLHIGYPRLLPAKSLCGTCAAPIMPILERLGLIKKES